MELGYVITTIRIGLPEALFARCRSRLLLAISDLPTSSVAAPLMRARRTQWKAVASPRVGAAISSYMTGWVNGLLRLRAPKIESGGLTESPPVAPPSHTVVVDGRQTDLHPVGNDAYQQSLHGDQVKGLGATVKDVWHQLLRRPDRFVQLDTALFLDPDIASDEYVSRYGDQSWSLDMGLHGGGGDIWRDVSVPEAASWRHASELVRLHPETLRILRTHPGDGPYDCLTVTNPY